MSTISVTPPRRCVALLHRYDFLDVLDVAAQRRQLRAGRITFRDEIGGELLQVHRQVPALRTRQESRQVSRMFAQECSDPCQPGALRFLDALGDDTRRNIDAVEHVADVVQDVRSHLGHARLPGGDQQLLVYALEFRFGEPPLGDVFDHGESTEWLTGVTDQTPRARQHGAAYAVWPDDDELGVTHLVTEQRSRQRTILARHRCCAIRQIDLGGEGVGVAWDRLDGFFRGNSKQLGRRAVVVRHLTPDVARNQRNREFGDDGGQQCLVLQQGGRHLLACGDVEQKLD